MKWNLTIFAGALCALLLFTSCKSVDQGFRESPIGSVVTGETSGVKGYLNKVEESNIQQQQQEEFEYHKSNVRAYNLKTGKYEHPPKHLEPEWNEEQGRWEFSP